MGRCQGTRRSHWGALSFVVAVVTMFGLVVARDARAQREPSGAELWGDYGWQQVGDINVAGGKIEIESTDGFGAGITAPLHGAPSEDLSLDLSFHRLKTHVRLKSGTFNSDLFDMEINHYQLGFVGVKPTGRASPFGRFSLGMMQAAPDASVDDLWMFEVGLGLGVKADLGHRLGLRMEANADFPLSFTSGSIWCGSGGCAGGVSGTSYLIQGGFRGALLLKL